MKALRAGLALALVVAVCMSPFGLPGPSDAADTPATWTIMIYMAADALPELPWRDNINSMEAADQALSTSVIALVDPLGVGDSQLLKIQQDPNGLDDTTVSTPIQDNGDVIPAGGEVNMADPATLTSFLQFSAAHYPSTRKMLVLWGHGAGWSGICPDGTDILTLPELRTALGDVGPGYSLDMVAVDACAAASFEMILQLMDYVDYFVAAENNVPFQGLPYTKILNDLAADNDISVPGFGSLIASDYIESAATISPYSTTMAVFDMSWAQEVASRLSSLSVIGLRFDDIFHGTMNDAVNDAESYHAPFNFDLGDFLTRLQLSDLPLELKTKAIDIESAFRELIVAFEKFNHPDPVDGIRVTNATGATIYAPSTSFTDAQYADLVIAHTDWYDFGMAARISRPTLNRQTGPELSYSDSAQDDDTLADSVTLTWPSTYDQYMVCIFRLEPGGYAYVGMGISAIPSFTISSWIGDLLLSASAGPVGSARTYDALNVTLYGTIAVTVNVTRDGQVLSKAYDVRVVMKGMTWNFRAERGSTTLNISVPTQVSVGDMMTFEVLSAGSDKVLGSARAVVPDQDFSVDVPLFSQERDPSGVYVLLLLSILPGALVLAFAAMLYREDRGRRKD